MDGGGCHARRRVLIVIEAIGELYGRRDIVRFLENVHPSRLSWRYVAIAAQAELRRGGTVQIYGNQKLLSWEFFASF